MRGADDTRGAAGSANARTAPSRAEPCGPPGAARPQHSAIARPGAARGPARRRRTARAPHRVPLPPPTPRGLELRMRTAPVAPAGAWPRSAVRRDAPAGGPIGALVSRAC